MNTTLLKRSGESRIYTADFSKLPELVAGDTLASAASVVAAKVSGPGGDLTVGAGSVNAARTGVQFVLSGGASGCRYRVTATAVTAGGSTLECVGDLIVDDDQ